MMEIKRRINKIKYSQIGKSDDDDFTTFIYMKFMNENYRIFDLDRESIEKLLKYKNFSGMNVEYPYKNFIIDYLDNVTDQVREIGEVNLIQEHKGRLFGFNTEYFGIIKLLNKFNIKLEDKDILIINDQYPVDTLIYVLKSLNYRSYQIVNYEEFKNFENNNIDIILNNIDFNNISDREINLEKWQNVEAIIDLNSNPIFSKLHIAAIRDNIKIYNGLYKALYKEKKTIEILTKQRFNDEVFEDILKEFVRTKLNIVLVGMPGAGKTTIGKKLARILNKEHIDLDREFYYEYGISPSQYLRYEPEDIFRQKESIIVQRLGDLTNKVISTSGGVVQLLENHYHLKKNSLIFRVDRNLSDLSTRNRPLSDGGIETLIRMQKDRREKYEYFTDYKVENRGDFDKTALIIADRYKQYIKNEI